MLKCDKLDRLLVCHLHFQFRLNQTLKADKWSKLGTTQPTFTNNFLFHGTNGRSCTRTPDLRLMRRVFYHCACKQETLLGDKHSDKKFYKIANWATPKLFVQQNQMSVCHTKCNKFDSTLRAPRHSA